MHTDNPAGRLLYILKEGQKRQKTMNCKTAWAGILDVEPENLALLMSRIGKVMELPNQVIDLVHNHYPNQSNTHKHWSKKVNSAFTSHNLNGTWDQFINHIDNHTIDYLSMTVDLLDVKEDTKILSEDELLNIHEKINAILVEVIELDVDDNFKTYIVKYLRKILISIEEYKISGATPIVESIESLLGHALIDETYRKHLLESDYGSTLVTTLGAIASIVTIAVGLPALTGSIQLLIGTSK